MFHGHEPNLEGELDFHVPEYLTVLGRAHAIEYVTDKKHGGGDGTYAVYRHEFETPAVLVMDERRGKQLYILGPKVTVSRKGIEN